MDPTQSQNLVEQFPLDIKTSEQSFGLDAVPLNPQDIGCALLFHREKFLFTTVFQGCSRNGCNLSVSSGTA